MKKETYKKIKSLAVCFIIMVIGLILFKFVPMKIYGEDILFDASMHITAAIFVLYIGWYFIDQNKNWRAPYLIFCVGVLTVIAVQRILANAHNDVGLLFGFIISSVSVMVSRWSYFKKTLSF